MRLLVLGFLAMLSQAASAEQASPLVGNWKIVSLKVVVDGEPRQDLYGARPKGYLIVTPQGRLISILTGDGRKFGTGDADRAALFRTMFAYSGSYRVERDKLIINVDTSWNEDWNGSQQVRSFHIEGNRLSLDSPATPEVSARFPGNAAVFTSIWERER